MSAAPVLPKAGDRVGFVCGPCQFPKDRAGTVVTVYADRWYDSNAVVLLDEGGSETIVGAYTTVGIGAYLIKRAGEVAA